MRQVSPKLVPFLEQFNATVAKMLEAGFAPNATNAREGLANLTKGFVTEPREVAIVQDDLAFAEGYNVPVRIYNPAPEKELPVLIYYHGGGHMAGSVTVYDPICRRMALATQHIVVAPEYRLAPENPYPAGEEDAYAVLLGVWDTLNRREMKYKKELSIAGDSAGGALCTAVASRAQYDFNLHIKKQAIIYPCVDYTMTVSEKSYHENAVGYLLHTAKCAWYFDNYIKRGACRKDASPYFKDFTDGLPETLVITAEFCPLRDEGKLYYEKVKEAGVRAEHMHFDDMPHTFMNLENLVKEECEQVYARFAEFLNS
ncbi:alpha/beta hydrolase [Rhodobacteraceae bacterium RKSG542]|uniref:alpha/beta hydrolase n=1 Tax=Pseudovibrio flavus TaxID=2529854 RepID=UPI0012BCD0FA|nr:alpha/beta hydrolase [Pseudovibrio flavus]MTI17130.1 alpha/beta hydrolase [Pseudovibrio flavus]